MPRAPEILYRVESLTGIVTRDIPLQLLDGVALRIHHPTDEISDGDQAHEPSVVDDRQVSDAVTDHQLHAFLNSVLAADGDGRAGDDFTDQRIARSPALQDNFTTVVTLGKNTYHLVIFRDYKSADVLLTHLANGFVDGVAQACRPDFTEFVMQDVVYGSVNFHGEVFLKFWQIDDHGSGRQDRR